MNVRQSLYFGYARTRGYRFPGLLAELTRDWNQGLTPNSDRLALSKLLRHCQHSVPYYSRLMRKHQCNPDRPEECLQRLPVLTKQLIRENFEQLQSIDIHQRRWHYNTSGGSTGEPIRLIQDKGFDEFSAAISLFFLRLTGREVGQRLIRLWGSERDIEHSTRNWRSRVFGWLTNTSYVNAFRMTPQSMRQCVLDLNRGEPSTIMAYAQAIFELAGFIEREQLSVIPQRAIVTSAGTLYPFMRHRIAKIFQCPVFNLYGSREVGAIASELPAVRGMWIHPKAQWVEILDNHYCSVPPGTPGNIIVTSLTNYAMPLVRYQIGDRGVMFPPEPNSFPRVGQRLKHVLGRSVDTFRTGTGALIDGEYFTHLLYFRSWVHRFQVIQRHSDNVLFKLVTINGAPPAQDLEDIRKKTQLVLGEHCVVHFEFVKDLPPTNSGKYRYTISEVTG